MPIIQRFRNILNDVVSISYSNPRKVLALSLALPVLCLIYSNDYRLLITIDDLVNSDYETSLQYKELKNNFHIGTSIVLMLDKGDDIDSHDLCSIRRWLSAQLAQDEHISSIHSVFNIRKPEHVTAGARGFDQLRFPPLVDPDCGSIHTAGNVLSALKNSPWDGLISDPGHDSMLIDISLVSMGEAGFNTNVIPELVRKYQQSYYSGELNGIFPATHWLGQGTYEHWLKQGLEHNNRLNIALIATVLILLRVFFGTWKAGLLFVSSLLYSMSILLGLMFATNTPIDVLTSTLFMLLTISTLGDFVFISHNNLTHKHHWLTSIKTLALPSLLTSLTTMAGFFSLCTSDLDIVQRLGFWAGLSGLIEWLTMFLLFPAVIKIVSGNKSWVNPERALHIQILSRLEQYALPGQLCIVFIALYLSVPFAPLGFNITDSPNKLFGRDHPFSIGIADLRNKYGFTGQVSLMFPSNDRPEVNEQIINLVSRHPNVAKVEDPYSILSYLTGDLPAVEKELVLSSLNESPALERLLSNGQARAILHLRETELDGIDNLRKYINHTVCAGHQCYLAGALVAYADFSQQVPRTLLSSFITSIMLVFGIIYLVSIGTGSKHRLHIMLSAFWGIALILCLLGVTGVALNFVTSAVVAILVGMTGDNAIHYLLADESIDKGLAQRSGASIISTTIMSICSLLFLFNAFEPPATFGLLLFAGLWASLAGDLWLLRGLTHRCESAYA